MANFNYLSFTTVYKAEYKKETLTELGEYACYGTTLRRPPFTDEPYGEPITRRKVNVKYTMLIHMGDKMASEKSKSNNCILPLKDVKRYLDAICELYPFKYRIIKKVPEEYFDGLNRLWRDVNVIVLEVRINARYSFHKFLLTAIRYLWESPYNFCLWEAFRLASMPDFAGENILFLQKLIMDTLRVGDEVHMLGSFDVVPSNVTKETITAALSETTMVNDIFDAEDVGHAGFKYSTPAPYNTETLYDEDAQLKRTQAYLHNYKIILGKR